MEDGRSAKASLALLTTAGTVTPTEPISTVTTLALGAGDEEDPMLRRALLLAIPLCVFSTAAYATTVLVTPSLNTTNVNNTLDCRVVNAGKASSAS